MGHQLFLSVEIFSMAMPVRSFLEEARSSFLSCVGFALFFLVAFAIFLVVWERRLGRACDQLYDSIARSAGDSERWSRVKRLTDKFSW